MLDLIEIIGEDPVSWEGLCAATELARQLRKAIAACIAENQDILTVRFNGLIVDVKAEETVSGQYWFDLPVSQAVPFRVLMGDKLMFRATGKGFYFGREGIWTV
jgi:hypothetical protein